MSATQRPAPAITLHKSTGQARVRLNGRDVYLGVHGTAEATIAYHRVIAEWEASGRTVVPRIERNGRTSQTPRTTVTELVYLYRQAKKRPGSRTWAAGIRPAMRRLRAQYGNSPAADFTPAKLKQLQRTLAAEKDEAGQPALSRGYINGMLVARVRALFKWGVSEGIVPETTHRALCTVEPLRYGDAPEAEAVAPVADVVVERTLPHLPPIVADMVQVQRLTGARPGEVCGLNWEEIDTSGDVWLFKPSKHKTAHHGRTRTIAIGPRAQAILMKYRHRPASLPLFSPAESEARRHALLRLARTAHPRANAARDAERKAAPKREYAEGYNTNSYGLAVRRAAKAAGVDPWHPNQLRHTAATAIRKTFGLDSAGAVLGHADTDTTQIYAERERELAVTVAAKVG